MDSKKETVRPGFAWMLNNPIFFASGGQGGGDGSREVVKWGRVEV